MTTLVELLALDLYSSYPCHFCGKSIIVKEGFIEGTDEEAYLLCDFCIGYSSFADVWEAWGIIADAAILGNYGYPWI